jgi:transposase-like protein
MESVLNEVLQSEMTDHLGAAPEERASGRSGYRNGSYERELTTRVGTLCAGIPAMEVPRDRNGTFSTELFGRYQRSEKALVLSLMQMVVQGVSTRRVKKITERLCGQRFSKSTVSELAKRLDEQVEAWAERSLGECPFLICDALQLGDDTSPCVRRQGAVRSTTVLLTVGVTDEGQHR